MRTIQLNSLQLNAVTINSAGERWRGSHAGAPPVVPDVPDTPDTPDIPEEPDVPSDPDVDENDYIIFADPEVKRVLLANGVGDGVGITKEAAAEVTSIGTWFKGNENITSFEEFSKFHNAQMLSNSAFEGCTSLRKIDLSNVTSLGNAALYGCTSLEIDDLNLPNLENIGANAFYDVPIKNISNLGSITAIRAGIINKTTTLKVVLPDTIDSLGNNIFSSSKVVEVFAPKVKTIQYNSFNNCTDLTTCECPEITDVQKTCFLGCSSLKNFRCDYASSLGVSSFESSGIEQISARLASRIYNKAFRNCTALSNITIPNVEVVEYNAFENCVNLSIDLDLPKVLEIGSSAFKNSGIKSIKLQVLNTLPTDAFNACPNLERVIIPSIVAIGAKVFMNCANLKSVLMGNAITAIDYSVFNSSTNLKDVVVLAKTPPTMGSNVFYGILDFKIYVPDTSVEAYKTATNWSSYASRILPISQLATDNPEFYAEIEEYL